MEKEKFNLKFPTIKETISKIKSDITYEKQYSSLLHYDLINENDNTRLIVDNILNQSDQLIESSENKALGCFIGLAIGDSLGCFTDNYQIDYQRKDIQNFDSYQNLRLPRGLFSDDTSLALCLADSLIANNYEYNAVDLRHRFALWWYEGLNNGKSPYFKGKINDLKELKQEVLQSWNELSFGIGNTLWMAILHFLRYPYETFVSGDMQKMADSNGSIMRLAPISICYHEDLQNCCQLASQQSKASHFGLEAADCCKILAFICASAINQKQKIESAKKFLDETCDNFIKKQIIELESSSANFLIRSQQEQDFEEDNFNQIIDDRNWNWKKENYKYSPTRSKINPEGVGAYSLDCLAMALNIVYYSSSFQQAIYKACNLGGDADTLGAVVGQIAGSIYGFNSEMNQLYKYVRTWDENKVIIRAYLLYHKKKINENK